MVVAAKLTISLAEFLQLPQTKPASEYIDGQIYQKSMPQGKHSKLQSELLLAISEVGERHKLVNCSRYCCF
jgi:Uma2 family endonuclease